MPGPFPHCVVGHASHRVAAEWTWRKEQAKPKIWGNSVRLSTELSEVMVQKRKRVMTEYS